MKTQHIKNCEVKVPLSNAFNIETAPHLPKLHCNMLFVAKRGSGKSVKMVNMLRMLKETGSMDRIFCVSPTFNSNKILLNELGIEDEDIYSDPDDESIILKKIDAVDKERDDYERYHEQMKRYKKFMKLLHSSNFNIPDEMLPPPSASSAPPPLPLELTCESQWTISGRVCAVVCPVKYTPPCTSYIFIYTW